MYKLLTINILYRRLALILLLTGYIGWIVDAIWPLLFIACLLIVVWHYHYLYKLSNWLWQSKHITPPNAKGIWGYIFEGIYRHNQSFRSKQRVLTNRIRQYRDGAEALPDAAMVLNNDFSIVWSNKKAQKLIGVSGKKDIGQRIDNLVRTPSFTEYLNEHDFDSPCSLTSPIHPDTQLEMRFMDYGSDQRLLLIRDISQNHRINAMRREFVANVSHELKTPLTVIRGYVEMMEGENSDIPQHWQHSIHSIEGQVTRMNQLVEQLLELSRVESNKFILHQPLKMPELIEQIVADVAWLNKEKNHQINCQIDKSLDILGQETEIRSACMNLLTNAIAYTQPNGQIDITWEKEDQVAVFTISDNGPGIKVEQLSKLTERFYRVDPSRSRETGGSGLGLSIVKHVLRNHNSKLIIKSQWGKGSQFSAKFDSIIEHE